MGAGQADQHQDCRGYIPDIMAISKVFYSKSVRKGELRRMAEVGRSMKAIDSDACQRCLSRSSSSSFSTLHRLSPITSHEVDLIRDLTTEFQEKMSRE